MTRKGLDPAPRTRATAAIRDWLSDTLYLLAGGEPVQLESTVGTATMIFELYPTEAQVGRMVGKDLSTLQLLQAMVGRLAAVLQAGRVTLVIVTPDGRMLYGRPGWQVPGVDGVSA